MRSANSCPNCGEDPFPEGDFYCDISCDIYRQTPLDECDRCGWKYGFDIPYVRDNTSASGAAHSMASADCDKSSPTGEQK